VIHGSVDEEEVHELSRISDFHLDSQYFKVVNVGTIYEGKGQDIVVDTAIALPKEHRNSFKFYIVGKVGSERFYKKLREKVAGEAMDNRIVFTGELPREDTLSCISECDAFLFPSRQESFPTAILEAMAFGKPIISTGVFGIAEQLEHGRTALIVSKESVSEVIDSLLRVYNDHDFASSIGSRARLEFRGRFELDSIGRQYQELIEALTTPKN